MYVGEDETRMHVSTASLLVIACESILVHHSTDGILIISFPLQSCSSDLAANLHCPSPI